MGMDIAGMFVRVLLIILIIVTVVYQFTFSFYDIEVTRTSLEKDAVHQYAETIALDALDKFVDFDLSQEGILYVSENNRPKVEQYFKNNLAGIYQNGNNRSGTVVDEIVNFTLDPGTYSEYQVESNQVNFTRKEQTPEQVPKITCTLKGTAGRITNATKKESQTRKTNFSILVDVKATHLEPKK